MAPKISVEKLVLQNFKAFRQLQAIDFKKKHVLIYGNNGSGKSSIFWGLYTFLQSSIKDNPSIEKYFKFFVEADDSTHQSLRNINEPPESPTYIKLFINEDEAEPKIYTISEGNIDTNIPVDKTIKLLNTASDFINYKLLSNFYRNTHKYELNLWPVFEKDIFPFITDNVTDTTFLEKIIEKTKEVEKYDSGYVLRNGWRKDRYNGRIEEFNQEIDSLLGKIQQTANTFLKEHFYNDKDVLKVSLLFDKRFNFNNIYQGLWSEDKSHIRESLLRIKLVVESYNETNNTWTKLQRVHSFLNEAQLTRIAIGIRIGALRARLQDADFKILVLDDMLISLDLSNRMEVTKIILNYNNKPSLHFFDKFQKIILTHDKGFYNILKNYTNPNEWEYYKLTKDENSHEAPTLTIDRTHIQKAQRFLADGEYEACGAELRKEVETILKKYLKHGLNRVSEDFQELSKMLKSAYETYTLNERRAFNKIFVERDIPIELVRKVETDFENDNTLSDDEKFKLRILKKDIWSYLYKQYEVKDEKEKLFKEIKTILDRIMNPASHASAESMYEHELEEAIKKVKEFKECLDATN